MEVHWAVLCVFVFFIKFTHQQKLPYFKFKWVLDLDIISLFLSKGTEAEQ